MRRTDRLYDLILLMRDGRLHRAEDLAKTLGVSVRTLYRDMETLQSSGLPIEGERGLGYVMTAPITLPPLNLTHDELDALHLGLSVVAKAGDAAKAHAATSLAEKIDAALPEDRAPPSTGLGFAVYPFADAPRGFVHIAPIRAAIRARRKIELTYTKGNETSAHIIRPLQTEFWGRVWTLTGWCETTQDFKRFRVDRIQTLDIAFDTFEEEPGKRLSDYLDRQSASSSGGYPAD